MRIFDSSKIGMAKNMVAKKKYQKGIELLARPVLPLVRLVTLLYLTGPFSSLDELLPQLNEEIDTGSAVYPDPAAALAPYSESLEMIERLKNGPPLELGVEDEQGNQLDPMETIELVLGQEIVGRELEEINSLLCGPCGCSLCCRGPEEEMNQEFFEIPLADGECGLFDLELIDTPVSRAATPDSEYSPDDVPFYRHPAAIYYFQNGPSLILPKGASCPNLNSSGGCLIYPERPSVCRKPQIFAYLIEKDGGKMLARKKILAVVDCPYVRELEEEIAAYAASCGLELVLRRNKE